MAYQRNRVHTKNYSSSYTTQTHLPSEEIRTRKPCSRKQTKLPMLTTTCVFLLIHLSLMLTTISAAPATAAAAATGKSGNSIHGNNSVLENNLAGVNVNETRARELSRNWLEDRPIVALSGILGTRLRKRHSKRHSSWYDLYRYNENTTTPEWVNPCGGWYEENNGEPPRRKTLKQMNNILKKSAALQLKLLQTGTQDINISDIDMWSLYEYQYKFLPKLKNNSKISLSRWSRNMQTYVASFAYLLRVQLHWDHTKPQHESRKSQELKQLLRSALRMSCELETAFNNTRPHSRGPSEQTPISRESMNRRLKLRTRTQKTLMEADPIDLKFVKNNYYEYLRTMLYVLRQHSRRKGQIAMKSNRLEFTDMEKNFGSKAASKSSTNSVIVEIGSEKRSRNKALNRGRKQNNRRKNKQNNTSDRRRRTTTLQPNYKLA